MSKPTWSAYHHLTLNVHDPATSEAWYQEVLGFARLTTYSTEAFERIILRHPESGATLGLNRHRSPEADVPFDERRTGLDHLAFQVADKSAVESWVARFDECDVTHSQIKPGAVPGSFLVSFRDPDGIQLEVFALPGS